LKFVIDKLEYRDSCLFKVRYGNRFGCILTKGLS